MSEPLSAIQRFEPAFGGFDEASFVRQVITTDVPANSFAERSRA